MLELGLSIIVDGLSTSCSLFFFFMRILIVPALSSAFPRLELGLTSVSTER